LNRLPVIDLAGEAYTFVWRERARLAALGWPYAAAFCVLLIVTNFGFGELWWLAAIVATLGQVILTAGFSYRWYRVVLFGPGAGDSGEPATRARYVLRYGLYVMIPLLAALAGLILTGIAGGGTAGGGSGAAFFLLLLMIATAYVMARLVFVLPATAVGVGTEWGLSWRQTQGNALSLILLMALQFLPFGVLNLLLDRLTLALLGPDFGAFVGTIVLAATWLAGTAVLVSMIGMAYWTLTGEPKSLPAES